MKISTIAILLVVAGLGGCADFNFRYSQGLQWHLDNEAQKKALNDQGFPQYNASE